MYRNDMLLHVNMPNLLHGRKVLLPVALLSPYFICIFFSFLIPYEGTRNTC